MTDARGDERRVVLRIVRGDPTPEEVAALVALLCARPAPGEASVRRRVTPSAWIDRARLVRAPLRPGPGAWRAAALP